MGITSYSFLGSEFTNRDVKRGSVLISEPFLSDDNFSRTVVLITEHNEKGSFGLVLNRPYEKKSLDKLVDGFENSPIPLFLGGPVEHNTLHFVHSLGHQVPSTIQISEHLFWGGDFEYLRLLSATRQLDPTKFKFFIGYSGWMPNQLNEEVKAKSWVVTNLKPDHIFQLPSDAMWSECLKSLGGKFKEWLNFPVDPKLN